MGFILALTIAAVIGKVIGSSGGGYLTGLKKREALTVGVGMNCRGMVELILAVVALEVAGVAGVPFTGDHVTLLVILAFITTLITPALLKHMLRKRLKKK